MYQFRDPVHGFIEISNDELRIINSPPFQRLRKEDFYGITAKNAYHGHTTKICR